jgi:hypothetical protein
MQEVKKQGDKNLEDIHFSCGIAIGVLVGFFIGYFSCIFVMLEKI